MGFSLAEDSMLSECFPLGGFAPFWKPLTGFAGRPESMFSDIYETWSLLWNSDFPMKLQFCFFKTRQQLIRKYFLKSRFLQTSGSQGCRNQMFSPISEDMTSELWWRNSPSPVNFYKHQPTYQIFFVSFELNYEKKMYLCTIKIKCNQSKTFNEPRRKKWI